MSAPPRMHDDQIDVPDAVVRSLVDTQFPQWSGLALTRLESDGTINRIDRLGDAHVVRTPFIAWGAGDVARDADVLPILERALPVEVPSLVARGAPGPGMPWEWGVYRWIAGRHPLPADDDALGRDLVALVRALRAMDPVGLASTAGFDARADDAQTRPRVQALGSAPALAAWDDAVAAAPPDTLAWIHGDLMPGNLLMRDESEGTRLAAVIDWGASGVGDPALDLLFAWVCLGPTARAAALEALRATPAEVARARGYAVRKVAWGLPYYRDTNAGFAATLAHTLTQIEAG